MGSENITGKKRGRPPGSPAKIIRLKSTEARELIEVLVDVLKTIKTREEFMTDWLKEFKNQLSDDLKGVNTKLDEVKSLYQIPSDNMERFDRIMREVYGGKC